MDDRFADKPDGQAPLETAGRRLSRTSESAVHVQYRTPVFIRRDEARRHRFVGLAHWKYNRIRLGIGRDPRARHDIPPVDPADEYHLAESYLLFSGEILQAPGYRIIRFQTHHKDSSQFPFHRFHMGKIP